MRSLYLYLLLVVWLSVVIIIVSQKPALPLQSSSGKCFQKTPYFGVLQKLAAWKRPGPYVLKTGSKYFAYPFQFCAPDDMVISHVPKKTQDFAELLPGVYQSYIYKDWDAYSAMYKRSRFGITHKKAGWDCMRHYEILALGSVPIFPDMELAPAGCMEHLPKAALAELLDVSGLHIEKNVSHWYVVQIRAEYLKKHKLTQRPKPRPSTVGEHFWVDDDAVRGYAYQELAAAFLEHTKKYLTCTSLASYALNVTGHANNAKVLFISDNEETDYLRDGLLYGLKRLLGDQLWEYKCIPHIRKESNIKFGDNGRWGLNFGVTGRLFGTNCMSGTSAEIQSMISSKYFDVVVYGSITRSSTLIQFVHAHVSPKNVLIFVGEDYAIDDSFLQKWSKFGQVFYREVRNAVAM